MCSGKCSRCIACTLYPLVLISIICNVVLFFPGGTAMYARDGHITQEVKMMGGLVGGGLLVLMSALYIHLSGCQGCCAHRFGMFLSIILAAVGAAGALYSLCMAGNGLVNGPLCKVNNTWTAPFKSSNSSYLINHALWKTCTEPKNVVEFNIGLFLTLMLTGCLQGVLCFIQMINGLFGCICGTGIEEEKA